MGWTLARFCFVCLQEGGDRTVGEGFRLGVRRTPKMGHFWIDIQWTSNQNDCQACMGICFFHGYLLCEPQSRPASQPSTSTDAQTRQYFWVNSQYTKNLPPCVIDHIFTMNTSLRASLLNIDPHCSQASLTLRETCTPVLAGIHRPTCSREMHMVSRRIMIKPEIPSPHLFDSVSKLPTLLGGRAQEQQHTSTICLCLNSRMSQVGNPLTYRDNQGKGSDSDTGEASDIS